MELACFARLQQHHFGRWASHPCLARLLARRFELSSSYLRYELGTPDPQILLPAVAGMMAAGELVGRLAVGEHEASYMNPDDPDDLDDLDDPDGPDGSDEGGLGGLDGLVVPLQEVKIGQEDHASPVVDQTVGQDSLDNCCSDHQGRPGQGLQESPPEGRTYEADNMDTGHILADTAEVETAVGAGAESVAGAEPTDAGLPTVTESGVLPVE